MQVLWQTIYELLIC